jgi:hypothetical protein
MESNKHEYGGRGDRIGGGTAGEEGRTKERGVEKHRNEGQNQMGKGRSYRGAESGENRKGEFRGKGCVSLLPTIAWRWCLSISAG